MPAIAEKLIQSLIGYLLSHPEVEQRLVEYLINAIVAKLEAQTPAKA